MSILLSDIANTFWQISTKGSGNIEQGLNDVRQCLDILLRTQKGSDPLRPEFGTNIYLYMDKPVTVAIPNIKREIIQAVALFETRVEIVSITHSIDVSHVSLFITYNLIDDDLIDQIQLYLSGGSFVIGDPTPQNLILEAAIPAGALFLLPSFITDGNIVLPTPPPFGFATAAQMFNWCAANWGNYGVWYLLPDKLVLFMKNGIAATASLSITAIDIYKYSGLIPTQGPGDEFNAIFQVTVGVGVPANVGPFANMADMLAFMQANFAEYGTWQIETENTIGDFSPVDFDDVDFNTIGNKYFLVLYTSLPNSFVSVEIAS